MRTYLADDFAGLMSILNGGVMGGIIEPQGAFLIGDQLIEMVDDFVIRVSDDLAGDGGGFHRLGEGMAEEEIRGKIDQRGDGDGAGGGERGLPCAAVKQPAHAGEE